MEESTPSLLTRLSQATSSSRLHEVSNTPQLSWQTPEYTHHERGRNWYLAVGITAAVFITIMIFNQFYQAAATFFMLAVVMIMYSQRKPRDVQFSIGDTGITYNDEFIPYHKLKSFWIHYDPPHLMTVNFLRKEAISTPIVVELGDQNPLTIRDMLLPKLFEDLDREESLPDNLARRLKF